MVVTNGRQTMDQEQASEFNIRAANALKWKRQGQIFLFPEYTPLSASMKQRYVEIKDMHFHDEENWAMLLYAEAASTKEGRNQFWENMKESTGETVEDRVLSWDVTEATLVGPAALKVLEKLESEA